MTSDEDLLRAWAEGDKQAGARLVERHMPTIYRFFRTKVPNNAEDLVQETFLGALERHDTHSGAPFRAYLLAIARRRLFRHFRTIVRADKKHELAAMSIVDVVPSPSGMVVAKNEVRVLLLALRKIPVDFQIVIELFYWERLSSAEIAVVLEVAQGTVKSRLSRAREALKAAIAEIDVAPKLRASTSDRLEFWAERLRLEILGDGES